MMNWIIGLIGTKPNNFSARATEWEIEPCPQPTILISHSTISGLTAGVEVREYRAGYWRNYSHACEVFPSPEAAKEYLKTQPPGKWHLFTETSHVCTESVLKEDC